MVKKVDINETLLKEYEDKDLIHYVATELRNNLSSASLTTEWALVDYGSIIERIRVLSGLVNAVDKRMNKESDDPKFAM